MPDVSHERIHFRLIQTPCCGHSLCWVNPRLPNHCPECGERMLARLRINPDRIVVSDPNAELKVTS